MNMYSMCYTFCRRGSLLSTAIFVYAATAPVNGYFSGGLYSRMGGTYTLIFACEVCVWFG